MNYPLLIAATVYVLGLITADYVPAPLLPSLASAIALTLLCLFIPRWRRVLLPVVFFALAFCNQRLQVAIVSPNDLRVLVGKDPVYAKLSGTLIETPYQKTYDRRHEVAVRTLSLMKVETIELPGAGAQPALGAIAISTPGVLDQQFFAGQHLSVSGVIDLPPSPLAEGLFDYRTYLQRQGIYYQLHVKSTNDWILRSSSSALPFADRFLNWAQKTLARGMPVEDESLRLLWAMTLGWKTALTGEVSEPFMRSGTMHIFAISGLHIALIAGLLVALFRVFQVPRGFCGAFVIPLIWIYTGFTGWQASAIRSTVMMTIIIAGWSLKRPSNLLNSLGAAALIILIWDPQQLFQASFQLSFFVVLSLGLFVPVLDLRRQQLLAPDPFLPPELRQNWRKRLDLPLNYITASFVTSLAAWLGSIPLVAYYFHLFTPVSLLANLVVVPLSSAALASNMASLICGDWLPDCGELFNHAAWFFMSAMIRLSQWAADWSQGSFHIPGPGRLAFLIYYVLLIAIMAGWFRRPRARVLLLSWLTAMLCLSIGLQVPELFKTRMTILPLGGGNAIFYDAPGRADDWLIDCGDESTAQHITKPFLQAQGVNRVAHITLTHGDIRHAGGAQVIWERFPAQHVYVGPTRFRSSAYRKIRAQLSAQPELEKVLKRGDRAGTWQVLHPGENERFPQADDAALVLNGEIRGTRVLLLSDLGRAGQNALVSNYSNLAADIVISGLPTHSEPLADLFLDIIKPRLIIVTDDLFPARARASASLKERLAARKVPVLYTSETGAITIEFTQNHWTLRTAGGRQFDPSNIQTIIPPAAAMLKEEGSVE